jgi:hypothetical protein
MTTDPLSATTTSPEAQTRLDVVLAIFKEHGHVNRHLISEKLMLTKLQASQLLREFLNANAALVARDSALNTYHLKAARSV